MFPLNAAGYQRVNDIPVIKYQSKNETMEASGYHFVPLQIARMTKKSYLNRIFSKHARDCSVGDHLQCSVQQGSRARGPSPAKRSISSVLLVAEEYRSLINHVFDRHSTSCISSRSTENPTLPRPPRLQSCYQLCVFSTETCKLLLGC